MFDCIYLRISSKIFKEYEWFDLYRDAKEAIPPNMNESKVHKVSISMFVDYELVGDNCTKRSHISLLIFINKSIIHWYIKSQSTVEAFNFGSQFCSMNTGLDMVEALCYKLQMFGVPIDGFANLFCENEAVYKQGAN